MNISPLLAALLGTMVTLIATTLGSSFVFFITDIKKNLQRIFLGFAAGVMVSASIWSLIIPSIDIAKENGYSVFWMPTVGGFLIGFLFLFILDKTLPHIHVGTNLQEGLSVKWKRTTMLLLAVILHNIPEGLAVGLAFGLAATERASSITMASAITLTIGLALQDLPEGAAISLPLRKEGLSKGKAFAYGSLSAISQPIAGVLGILIALSFNGIMPWMLAFAAGAMIYIVVEELIPQANLQKYSTSGTAGVLLGFMLMMILNVSLG